MDKDANMYLNKLDRIVRELEYLETDYYKVQNELMEAKLQLNIRESGLICDGIICGKNEQTRNAQLLGYTGLIQTKITNLESELNARKARLYAKRRELDNLQYYTRLLEALNHHN